MHLNNKRREKLKQANQYLERAYEIVSNVLDDEEMSLYNIPENLQGSEKYDKIETAVDNLESVIESVESAQEYISTAIE